ncbi:bifunctional [glutamate--ammonia ligase]-adenylyl-L-tyrosine phosphorylase/[glutamate--ammonia-ligase] adenylyltransferase [Nitrococcus mobilis]|uniref:Bifunctional glutamine synthetase adenylyltransferase/adenylyl-removing enzyme n=1 Tax=Nitrococcus mobilis Nb-231 TaxID=314278 RepID=A4BVL4_9GAMM|nr:bifunctional [glutamate--ammonia ligase]-adenylyl-L-tyrosine phosphorylase/[glutamate--ammonia-ligase] adenylyltransferase [Nitrococcus mobilis]EAR20232.1 Glutamate-ammonia-ligase adenylyltransferase [Nitrococcus mobilis Nb-231]
MTPSEPSQSALHEAVASLPEPLREPVRIALQGLDSETQRSAAEPVLASLPAVWACSNFITRACRRDPKLLEELFESGDLERSYPADGYRTRLHQWTAELSGAAALKAALRRFRCREMVRIAWRDLAGWAELDDTLQGLSALAEACINQALACLHEWLREQWGTPRDAAGEPQQMIVLGMGKLGGRELNFSSDIDLIFCYPEPGHTDGTRPLANEEYFTRLGRQLIAALDEQTPDGQAFRVDMRLRPYGQSGPLVTSFNGMEIYYQTQGREWERYALIKARVVGGDYERGGQLLEELMPFVYRRYLDYGAMESLRAMKALVAREVQRKGLEDNIKLGRGGIREIEFIAQVFQLIRGGQERALRRRGLLAVLDCLAAQGQLPRFAQNELSQAYRFLRRLENRLQMIDDRQTHELPSDALDRLRLAHAMGYPDYATLRRQLDGWRQKVQEHFDQVFVAPQGGSAGDDTEPDALAELWQGTATADEAAERLAAAGFEKPAEAHERLTALHHSHGCRALSAQGRNRLDRLMPMLVRAIGGGRCPDATLPRVLQLLESVAQRTAYLALLNEHPLALSQLVQLCAGSPWIAQQLTRHPILLDELLDPRTLYAPLGRDALQRELTQRLEDVPPTDLEQQMEVLRHCKQTNNLRVAAADLSGAVPLMVVSDYLTDIAEVVLEAVLSLAWRHVSDRYGQPTGRVNGASVQQGLVILAYGKLGSFELGYGSDLDLVFIHEAHGEQQMTDGARPVDNPVFFARLVQRIIHILTTPTPGGVLYAVDTRLRPSGKAGLLTSSLEAFSHYQLHQAWTWEHQALVRSRVVAGSPHLAKAVEAIRRQVLTRRRDSQSLRREVRQMRERMRREKAADQPGVFDLKQDRGGIADIEFMVQYGVLACAAENPALLRYTDNIRLLDELSSCGWISAKQAQVLAEAYRAYRACVHRLALQEQPARTAAETLQTQRDRVAELWLELMGADDENG